MKKQKANVVEMLGVMSALLIVTVVLGHGCSQMKSINGSNQASGGGSVPLGTTGGTGAGSGFTPKVNSPTVSMVYNKMILDNMVTCSGIGRPSLRTQEEWKNRQSSFSEFGYATDVTAPMMMALTAVAGEVCNDLLNIETKVPAGSRRIFNSVNFDGSPAAIATGLNDVVRRLARSCWGRNEEADELEIISEEFTQALGAAAAGDSQSKRTRDMALFVCTGVMSSLNGITL